MTGGSKLRKQFAPVKDEPMHQHSGIFTPLRSPWIVTDQFDEKYKGLTWQQAHALAEKMGTLRTTLPTLFCGYVAYQSDEAATSLEVAAFCHDSSD